MAELSAIRARLQDRQRKEGALGTTEVSVCLDLDLLDDLKDLDAQRAEILNQEVDARSLAGRPSTSEVDAAIEQKRAEIRESSLRLVFKALSSDRYQVILNAYEEPDGADQPAFMDQLAAACFWQAWAGDEKTDLEWSEITPSLGFGETDEVRTKVFFLNRRKQDIPFSLKPSRKTQH